MKSIKTEIGDYTGKYFKGYFNCVGYELITLEGAPRYVGESFNCMICPKLESLQGAPEYVGGNFNCHNNKLTSLEGAPKSVGGRFYCDKNIKKGENLYIIANALLNGRKGKRGFEEVALGALIQCFIEW